MGPLVLKAASLEENQGDDEEEDRPE